MSNHATDVSREFRGLRDVRALGIMEARGTYESRDIVEVLMWQHTVLTGLVHVVYGCNLIFDSQLNPEFLPLATRWCLVINAGVGRLICC